MSTDADRIEFTCPTCGAQHNRGYVNGVDTFRCLKCGYVGPGRCPTSQDRIAQLTAELAEARSSRNEWERRALDRNKSIDDLDRQCDAVTRQRDITRSEEARLTAELATANAEQRTMRNLTDAELAEARRDRDDARLAADSARNDADQAGIAHERTKTALRAAEQRELSALADADEFRAERDAAQADAAAMREALSLWLQHYSHGPVVLVQLGRAALAGTAGRALAERVTLWRELEEEMRTATKGKSLKQLLRILQGVRQDDHLLAVLSILYKLEDLAALDAKGGG